MHFMGSIHALEHASIGLMPLMVMADRNDFGGISTPMHAQLGMPAVFVYDGLPGPQRKRESYVTVRTHAYARAFGYVAQWTPRHYLVRGSEVLREAP